MFSLLGIQVVVKVSVHGKKDIVLIFLIFPDFSHDIRQDGRRLFGSQGTVDKVILHIYYD